MFLNGQRVEWDEEKNKINIKKHGISFETASLVFADINRLKIPDIEHSDFEERYKLIGKIGEKKVVLTVCTNRKEAVRIISARKATLRERKMYYDSIQIYL